MIESSHELLVKNRASLRRSRLALLAFSIALLIGVAGLRAATVNRFREPANGQLERLTSAEFSNLIRDVSEEGGYFFSDNLISNETPYLTVVDKLRRLGATGGAYIGVGPEQNFTYIAKVRPRIAFIMDIRRQAVIQHLMYKALFHLSPTPAAYLSHWLSRPLTKDAPAASASITEVLAYFSKTRADDQTYARGLAEIRRAIQEDFQFTLSARDRESLEYVYRSFRDEGLDTAFRLNGWTDAEFPSLREVILQPDQHGKLGNFLTSREDYEFVRGLHLKNLIIPIVGDFGGKKALVAIGDYLRKSGFTVTAFYLSNVEQYLFEDGSFPNFANNVRKLPRTDNSLFIRWVYQRYDHPARLAGQRSTSLLQRMNVFLTDFDAGRYQNYIDLISTNYIAPDKS
ncbi:MAG TPA: hypothetical protein VLU47_15855 [Blastocatellia bacterium]|nr:hypothetical protein [Blastocatellia bacterium]